MTALLLQASKVSKVQQGAMADAAAALGSATGSNSLQAAQAAAQNLVTQFTGASGAH